MDKKARIIAYYLPQFHPVAENDKFWGKGFTEWTNVAKAKPLFKGHQQPRVPADLGFYDLRLSEVRKQQVELAKEAGIEGFCYWHYWFGNGKEVLEMPFDEVVKSGEPDFPFCLGWANHSWTTKTWEKGKNSVKDTMIFEQTYPGVEDHIAHFYRLLPAFKDPRYIKVDGKLLFNIFASKRFPDIQGFFALWNQLAKDNGLVGFHFVALVPSLSEVNSKALRNLDANITTEFAEFYDMGFDAINSVNQKYAEIKTAGTAYKAINGLLRKIFPGSYVERYDYKKIMDNYYSPEDRKAKVYPQLLAGWDRSPRSGRKAVVYYNNTPESFEYAVKKVLECVEEKDAEHRIIFLNSWNEWGEGAYMEPDLRYGKKFIQILGKNLSE